MKRITLIARKATKPSIDWNQQRSSSMSVAFLNSVVALKFALFNAVTEGAGDVERLIIDRASSGDELLELLSALPDEFNGDVLAIREDGNGHLSAAGRGGNRILYSLVPRDVRFYLETHDLVTGRLVLEAPFFQATA